MKKSLQLLLLLLFNFSLAQEGGYEILNTSINSKFAELGVTYSSSNSVIFASSKKDKDGKRATNRQLYLELYHGTIMENGDIVQTNKFSNEINNKFFESDIAFTPDFKTIYFTWNNFYSALKSKDSAKWKTLYMFKASINENFEISAVTPMPFNSKDYSVRSPAVSADGKKLYFVSDMPGGFGELDVYAVDINNEGNYGAPKNLGAEVNTNQTELFPYIDQNNMLYFSSNGHKGLGGLDIFKSEFKNGKFQQAVNLPAPFNSKYDDFAFVIDASNSGYFTSNRSGGKGDVDIYAFKEKEPKCNQYLIVLAINELTEQPIDQVLVSLFQNNKLVEKQTISKNSGFKFSIKCNETYKLVAEKENYETAEISITTDDKNKSEITKTLKLTPIECLQLLSGNISDSKTNLSLDQVTVSLFENNKLIEKQTISKNLNFKFSVNCKESYKLVAEKENYETVEITFKTDDKINFETKKTLKLTPIECNQLLSGNISDSKTNLPLDQVSVSLFQNNQLVEKQTIGKNSGFKFSVNCKETYKLIAEKENYETAELSITTDDKINFETKKTLKLTPIECVQLLSGNISDSKTNLSLDQVSVSLFQNNQLVEKQIISKGSNFKFSVKCKESYKLIAQKENYETVEITFKTDDKINFEIKKTLKLTPIECVQLLSGNISDSKTNLSLDQVTVSLFENNKLVEKQTISKNLNFKFSIKCNETYKLVAEKENYETAEITFKTDDKINFETKKTLKLTPIECVQFLSGDITDSKTNLLLDQVNVSLFENNQLVEKQTIGKNSDFKFNLKCNETYKLVAEKENYETVEITFKTDDKINFEIKKRLKLTPIECVQLLSGNISDSKTNLSLDQVTVSLFENNKLIEKQTISKNLNFKFSIKCNETYKLIAEKENYETAEITFKTDDKINFETKKTLKLTPIECVQFLSGDITDSKSNLLLDQVTVSLFQNNKLVEKQTIGKNSDFKFNLKCNETYKLVAEKENYETVEITFKTDDKINFEIKKRLKLTPMACVQLLSGNISDSKTNLSLDQVTVSLFENNKLIEKQTISKNLNFKFSIKCNETYKLVAEKENYETAEITFKTDDKINFETTKTLKLTPIECVQLLSGIVTDSETNLPLPNAIVHIYRGKELLAKLNLDDNATFNYKLDCEMPYRFTVSLNNYHNLVTTVKTTNKTNENLNIKLEMESSVEFVEVREQKMIKTKTIYFDLDQSSIRLDAAIELNKVIAILRKYPNLKIEIKSHTDSRASAEYNLKLTNDRAKKVIDYIISNGIDSSRVSGRGYGETQLLNNCAKGVKCSEAEHQMNRRTEFIITDE